MAEYFARRPFGYGRLGMLDRGQVVELLGVPNDEKLIRLGYLMEYKATGGTSDCGECGMRFTGDAERAAHGSDRHRDHELDPIEEDARIEKRERMLEKTAPLFYERTIASQQSGQAPVPTVTVPDVAPAAAPATTAVAEGRRREPRAKREPATN